VPSLAAPLLAIPPLPARPAALPEVTIPAVEELTPVDLPALDELDASVLSGSDPDALP
jgi:hypothetical protein